MALHNKAQDFIHKKISKIMHEGIRGKKVGQKQAVAVAHSMAREKGMAGAAKRRK